VFLAGLWDSLVNNDQQLWHDDEEVPPRQRRSIQWTQNS